jgi:hypothetical protein
MKTLLECYYGYKKNAIKIITCCKYIADNDVYC